MTFSAWALAAALAATGASSDEADGELTAKNGRPASVDASRGVVFGMQWRRPLIRTGIFRSVAASFGRPGVSKKHGLLVVGSGEGEVRAYGLADGTLVWRHKHGRPFETAVTIVRLPGKKRGAREELAVLGSRDGSLLAFDVPTGALRWKVTIDGDSRAPISQSGKYLLVATANNKICVINAADGKSIWTRGRPPPSSLTVTGHARAIAVDGVVYATFSDGYAEAFKLADGSSLWSRPLSLKGGEFVDADADPVLSGGRLFVASYSDGIFALDPKDGKTIWTRSAPAVTSLAAHDDLILAASADGYVWGLSQAEGQLVYRTRLPPGPTSRLAVDQNMVVLTAGDVGLIVLDARDGKPLQATSFGSALSGDPMWDGDDLALLSSTGYLYKLRRGSRGLVE